MSNRIAPRGQARPVDPAWQLSQAEIVAMLARPYFQRFIVVRRQCRISKTHRAEARITLMGEIHDN